MPSPTFSSAPLEKIKEIKLNENTSPPSCFFNCAEIIHSDQEYVNTEDLSCLTNANEIQQDGQDQNLLEIIHPNLINSINVTDSKLSQLGEQIVPDNLHQSEQDKADESNLIEFGYYTSFF